MRALYLAFLWLIPFLSYSQDIIILRSGEQIECKITRIDSAIVYYDFVKGDRKLSSYILKNDIRSYNINEADTGQDKLLDNQQFENNTVIIDTTEYVKEISKWINSITYSQRYGMHAKGWSVQYYGYLLRNTSNWSIPVLIGIERFRINSDYFSQFDYQSASMSYYSAGISPFNRLVDNFYLNIGINIILGEEELTDFSGRVSSGTFFGLSPCQGIFFIAGSDVGIVLGLSVYEKILNSEVYKNDVGFKLEIGIKF